MNNRMIDYEASGRFVKASVISAVFLALAACQSFGSAGGSASGDPADAAATNAKAADLRFAQAFCSMIDEANRRQAAAGKPLPENDDCAYFARVGTMEGYAPPSRNQYTGFFANVRDISRYSKAQNAKPPTGPAASSAEGVDLYKRLLGRGFDQPVAASVAGTPAFARAVSAFRAARAAKGL